MIHEFVREPTVDQCTGCSYIIVGPEPGPSMCNVYLIPASQWEFGRCPLASHIKVEEERRK